LRDGKIITKRNLYYKLVHYYSTYDKIDQDLEALGYNLNLPKEQLCIVSSSRTLILGDITCRFDGLDVSLKK
jgi:DNA topoisomerase VI subunit A